MCPSGKMMEFVNGKDDYSIYEMEKVIQMFETTSRIWKTHEISPAVPLFLWGDIFTVTLLGASDGASCGAQPPPICEAFCRPSQLKPLEELWLSANGGARRSCGFSWHRCRIKASALLLAPRQASLSLQRCQR
jgi:hypothetical protein